MGCDCTPKTRWAKRSVGEQSRVVDAEFAQAFHVEVEFLDAGKWADAHAMQRAGARHLIEAREFQASREQHLDATACILVIGEHSRLDIHGRVARYFRRWCVDDGDGWWR